MSERSELAARLAEVIIEKRMTAPFGGDVEKGKRSYDVLFAKPRWMDGLVQVFGPKFILIQMQGPHAPGGAFKAVFESEADARTFLEAIADCDFEAANQVPTRGR